MSYAVREPEIRHSILLLLLFLTSSALVANPKKLLYTVANPACGLLNREKKENVYIYVVKKSRFQKIEYFA